VNLRFGRRTHRIDFAELTGGKGITIYAQHEVIKDLNKARREAGGQIFYEVEEVSVHDFADAGEVTKPSIRFRSHGEPYEMSCDFIAGCDGFHGICRPSVPSGVLTLFDRTYPFGWLGILADVAPSCDELIYSYHERGFALLSMRSPVVKKKFENTRPAPRFDAG